MEELEDRVDEINGTLPGDRTYSSIRPKSEHPYGTINWPLRKINLNLN